LKNLDPELINKFESQFERGKISKIIAVARKEQLMNRLLFCQYCSEIFINPTQQQKHLQYKKYNEFDKDIKLYVAEAQVCFLFNIFVFPCLTFLNNLNRREQWSAKVMI
jgi:hypothetical protein